MLEYAAITGLSPVGETPRRYLWTDAFAVCNLLGLFRQTGDKVWRDPLDGYVTCSELQASAGGLGLPPQFGLEAEIADLAAICQGRDWATDDPLGIGGLLGDAWRIAQLTEMGVFRDTQLLESVVDGALAGLTTFVGVSPLNTPAAYRLAFRELGLSIGLKGAVLLRAWSARHPELIVPKSPLERKIEALAGYLPLAGQIEGFWLEGSTREAGTWREHREINMVMLATSLAPDGFLSV